MKVAQSIFAASGGSKEDGVVGPRARSGLGSFRSLATFNASFSMLIAPTSPLSTAMMIL